MKVDVDEAFGLLLDNAVSQWQADRPRSKQKLLGPSSLGGCREYIRATIMGDEPADDGPEVRGVDAAFIGTVVGDALEEILAQYLGALTQVNCTVTLPKTKLVVSGNSDLVFVDQQVLADLKGCDSLSEVIADLAKEGFHPKNKYFKYAVQVAVYVLALVQAGKLRPGATARLVFFERSGKAKKFLAIPFSWESLMKFIDLAEERLQQVQKVIEKGSPEESRWELRDQSTSLCFYTKCPFRLNCWKGGDWVPNREITGEDEIAVVDSFVENREAEKQAKIRKELNRETMLELFPDGGTTKDWAVSFRGPNKSLYVIPLLPKKEKI